MTKSKPAPKKTKEGRPSLYIEALAAEICRHIDRPIWRRNPCPTLELAAAGAAQVLGPDHGVTKALARASITMAKVDLWRARLAVQTLRRDQREAIAASCC